MCRLCSALHTSPSPHRCNMCLSRSRHRRPDIRADPGLEGRAAWPSPQRWAASQEAWLLFFTCPVWILSRRRGEEDGVCAECGAEGDIYFPFHYLYLIPSAKVWLALLFVFIWVRNSCVTSGMSNIVLISAQIIYLYHLCHIWTFYCTWLVLWSTLNVHLFYFVRFFYSF